MLTKPLISNLSFSRITLDIVVIVSYFGTLVTLDQVLEHLSSYFIDQRLVAVEQIVRSLRFL